MAFFGVGNLIISNGFIFHKIQNAQLYWFQTERNTFSGGSPSGTGAGAGCLYNESVGASPVISCSA